MDALGVGGLLGLWEQGRTLNPVRRALLLLGGAWPQYDPAGWAHIPIGVRDAWLVSLRAALFGARFEVLADCPACGTTLESVFTAADLPAASGTDPAGALELDGYRIAYRLPTSEDLLAVAEGGGVDAGALLARCVEASRGDRAVAADALPDTVRTAIERAMDEHDPGARIEVGLRCDACGHHFARRFDILDHLWGQLEEWAERLLGEVHLLARAYGWSERDILALPPARRQHYVGLAAT